MQGSCHRLPSLCYSRSFPVYHFAYCHAVYISVIGAQAWLGPRLDLCEARVLVSFSGSPSVCKRWNCRVGDEPCGASRTERSGFVCACGALTLSANQRADVLTFQLLLISGVSNGRVVQRGPGAGQLERRRFWYGFKCRVGKCTEEAQLVTSLRFTMLRS